MYRFNLISRMSKCVLSNVGLTRATVNVRRYICKNNIFTMSSQLGMTKRSRFYNNNKSHGATRFYLFATSLPTLIFSYFFDTEKLDDEEVPELIMAIKRSVLLIQRGEYKKAEQMLHLALRQAQTLQHYDGITYIYDVMANLAFDTGDYHKAEQLFVSVLQRLISNGVPENDVRVVHISLKMAKVFEHIGDLKKAEQGYKFCIENLQSHIQQDDKDVILLQGMTFDWYAQMLFSQSRHTEALHYFLQAYNICKMINSEEHEQTVVLLNNLGTVSHMLEDYDEALKYLSAAAKIGKNLADTTDLDSIYINLGNVFLKKGLYDEAKRSCQEGKKLAKSKGDNNSLLEANECLKEIKKFYMKN